MNGTGSAWRDELQNQRSYGQTMMQNESDMVYRQPVGNSVGGGGYENSHVQRPNQFGQHNGYRGQRHNGGFTPRNQDDHGFDDRNDGNRATGHQAFLKGLMRSAAVIRLVTIAGDEYTGVIKGCDETTISIRISCATPDNPDAYQNRVFFKHNLIEFAPVVDGVKFS